MNRFNFEQYPNVSEIVTVSIVSTRTEKIKGRDLWNVENLFWEIVALLVP